MSDILPPQAIEAEQSIIGSLLSDNRLIDEAADMLESGDFYQADHRKAFEAICALGLQGQPADLVTVSERLDGSVSLQYLGDLIKNTPRAANIKNYCKIVRARAVLRRVIEISSDASAQAYRSKDAAAVVDAFAGAANELSLSKSTENNQRVSIVIGGAMDELDDLYKSDQSLKGLSTGFIDIDHHLNGLQAGRLYIVAGRPSMGKTCLALNWIEAACKFGKSCQLFTLEMPSTEIGNKLLSSQSGVNYGRINRPKTLTPQDWHDITQASGAVQSWKLFIDDSTGITLEHIRTTCRKAKRAHGLDLVVIDYLQLMSYGKAERVDLAIGDVTGGLKGLSKQLDCPIVLLSQLNRSLEQRPNKRPVMSDLRDSGSIEQDADAILMVYRDEVYDPGTEHKGIAEINFAKNRSGERGVTARLVFQGENQRFQNSINRGYDHA